MSWLKAVALLPAWFHGILAILVGVAVGFLPGLVSFAFWAFDSNRQVHRTRPDEAIGGMAIGCFGLGFSIALGAFLSYIITIL